MLLLFLFICHDIHVCCGIDMDEVDVRCYKCWQCLMFARVAPDPICF